ncbi:hypothetical protein EYC84_001959 [Monilinia fructicola]|uniref:Protein kinase domain-containing protein n=1 Tax=Monilinia fructicola TaxID=38448 RepID=A0A5M9JV82_MONFR|nr:hypothetical protein EYC84_001959 [Monilinia fructicola]
MAGIRISMEARESDGTLSCLERRVKVLGEGGYGTAGRWELVHGPLPDDDEDRLPFKSCVVKQQSGYSMQSESSIHELFRHVPSQHLVKMYRRMYQDQGLGTVRADRKGPVYRMYLEDCEGGDLDLLIKERFQQRNMRYGMCFHCLARALYAMHYGHEELDRERWDRDEVVHFDLKGLNVFIGGPQKDDEHRGATVIKIGDYGQAAEVPNDQDLHYNYMNRWLGTELFKTACKLNLGIKKTLLQRPWMEDGGRLMDTAGDGNVLNNLRYGTHSNVWQLGLIIWRMIHCTEWCEDGNEEKPYKMRPELDWQDHEKWRIGPPGRFLLKLYAVSNTWLGLTDEGGGVHTLATQDDINYYNGEYDDLPPGHYDYQGISDAEKTMNKRRIEIENRARAKVRDSRLYSDELHKLVMDCLIVQQESRIHVEELYRATKKFKEFWVEKAGPQAPLPYSPEPPVDDAKLPPPWNDLTTEQGGGLGRPVPESIESHELGIDDLFHATVEYEQAALALAVMERNRQHFVNYKVVMGQYRGQRTRPVYQVPEAFPKGFIKDANPYDDDDDEDQGGGGGLGGGGGPSHPSQERQLSDISNRGQDSDATPDYLKDLQSTPEHMRARFSDTPPELQGRVPRAAGNAGGGLGGFVPVGIGKQRLDQELGSQFRSRSSSSLPHRGSNQRREREKAKAELEAREREIKEQERLRNWPVFPIGLQKSVDKVLIARALEIPELRDTVLFCTVAERQTVKGIIYLVGLKASTTVLQMKEMLTEKETGVPVEDMKLMGNDWLTVFREFEDEEFRSVIHGIEIFVCDITKMER